MWSNKYIKTLLIPIILMSLLLSYVMFCVLYHKIKIEVYDTFKEVVYLDIDMRGQKERIKTTTIEVQQYSPDSIMIQQDGKLIQKKKNLTSKAFNKYCIMQRFLSTRVPVQIQVVDSLFNVALQQANIPGKTVVKCSIVNGLNSADNAVICSKDISLWNYYTLPVFKMEDTSHDFTMSFQGFIKCPFGYLLKNAISMPLFWILLIAYFGVLLWIIKRSIKAKLPFIQENSGMKLNDPVSIESQNVIDDESIDDKSDSLSPKLESDTLDVITPIKPVNRDWLIVTENILFDENTGEIKYNNEIVLQLKGLNLKLFTVFVKEIGLCVKFDRMKKDIWENKDVDNKTISLQINRLSNELSKKIDTLSFENIRGMGYRLIVDKQSQRQFIQLSKCNYPTG